MFITLNHRMFMATADAKYIDVMERGMYNNAIDGVSASGNRFFYVNRLASAGDGRDTRWERASLECCPPNLVRFLASMPGLIYAQDKDDAIFVNLYVSSEASFKVAAKDLALAVESEMPWGGKSRIKVSASDPVKGTVKLRIPGWARNRPVPGALYSYADKVDRQPAISVNGKSVSAVPDANGYVSLAREWSNGDLVEIEFPIEVRRVSADQRVVQDRRRLAVERGPIVYCAEWPDVERRTRPRPAARRQRRAETVGRPGFPWRVTAIQTQARRITNPSLPATPVTLIPVLPLGQPRQRGNERLVVHGRICDGRHWPCRRVHLLREPELCRGWMAVPRSGALRSERGRGVGLLPARHRRRPRHGRRHRQAEHRSTCSPRAPNR